MTCALRDHTWACASCSGEKSKYLFRGIVVARDTLYLATATYATNSSIYISFLAVFGDQVKVVRDQEVARIITRRPLNVKLRGFRFFRVTQNAFHNFNC